MAADNSRVGARGESERDDEHESAHHPHRHHPPRSVRKLVEGKRNVEKEKERNKMICTYSNNQDDSCW